MCFHFSEDVFLERRFLFFSLARRNAYFVNVHCLSAFFCLKSERPQLWNRNSEWGDSNAHVLCSSSSFWWGHFLYICTFWKCPFYPCSNSVPLIENRSTAKFSNWSHPSPEYSSNLTQANLLSWAPNLHVDFACTSCVCLVAIVSCLFCLLLFQSCYMFLLSAMHACAYLEYVDLLAGGCSYHAFVWSSVMPVVSMLWWFCCTSGITSTWYCHVSHVITVHLKTLMFCYRICMLDASCCIHDKNACMMIDDGEVNNMT